MNDCGHDVQHLCFPRVGNISVIVYQNSLEKWWDHVCVDHLQIISFLHIGIDQFKNLLFDSPEPSDFRGLGGDVACRTLDYENAEKKAARATSVFTIVRHGIINELTGSPIHVQHIMVDATNLGIEVSANRGTCCDVRLHNVADDLYRLSVLEDGRVLIRLSYNSIPCRIGKGHQVLNQTVLEAFLTLCRNHIAARFVESVNLLR
jgi:hypothetical protein